MTMRTLACKTVTAFAAGLIAGAALGQVRMAAATARARGRTARPETVTDAAKPAQETATTPAPAVKRVQSLTKQQLYLEAKQRNIRGRSTMTKAELQRALLGPAAAPAKTAP